MFAVRGVQVLCLFVYVSTVSSSHVVFTASPSVIQPLVTDVFTLRCDLKDGQLENNDAQSSDVKFAHSLLIRKNGGSKTAAIIATVTQQTAAMLYNQTSGMTVSGQISGSTGFLEVTWQYPDLDSSGRYKCSVSGAGQAGHLQNFIETVEVSDTGLNHLVDYVRQLSLTSQLQGKEIASLKKTNVEQTSTIESLQQTSNLQSKSISELNQKNTGMQEKISELQQKQNTNVIFSAYLDHKVTAQRNQVIVFNQVQTNIGNAYNPSTGVFTCSVSGYYAFDVRVTGQANKKALIELRLNGAHLVGVEAEEGYGRLSDSAHVNVKLSKGDKVKVAAYSYFISYLQSGPSKRVNFSGFLINVL